METSIFRLMRHNGILETNNHVQAIVSSVGGAFFTIAALAVTTDAHGGDALPADTTAGAGVELVRTHRQHSFKSTVPPGNYSGITWLGDKRYAVVSDKSETDGFFIFEIDVDSVFGKIRAVEKLDFVSSGRPNRDQEGIAYLPSTNTLFVCGENGNEVLEYELNGQHTGRKLELPDEISLATENYGLESLSYNANTHKLWTVTESTLACDGGQASYSNPAENRLRLMCFNDSLKQTGMYFYNMDKPLAKRRPREYAMGVSEVCALDDGRLIVMEREFYVSRLKLGSWVNIKMFVADPTKVPVGGTLQKTLLHEFRTRLRLFRYNLANYEGMCLGPELHDGGRVIIMVSDSQNRYGGVLKDYFKSIVIREDAGG